MITSLGAFQSLLTRKKIKNKGNIAYQNYCLKVNGPSLSFKKVLGEAGC